MRNRINTENLDVDCEGTFYFGSDEQFNLLHARRWRRYRNMEEGSHLLLRDIHLGILPIGSSHDEKWSVKLVARESQSPIQNAEEVLTHALDREYHAYDLRDGLQEFLPECAQNVVLEGRSVYEIVLWRDKQTQNVRALRLVHLPWPSVGKNWRGWYQRVPAQVARERHLSRRLYLEAGRIVCFHWPLQLGSNALRRATLEAEKIVTDRLMPSFALPRTEMLPFLGVHFPRQNVPYDYKAHSRARSAAHGCVGRRWGYGHRNLLMDEMGDFFYFERTLLWERFLVQLREALLLQLNEAIIRLEQLAGPLGQIQVEGLPSLSDADSALQKLREGPSSYSALTKPFRL